MDVAALNLINGFALIALAVAGTYFLAAVGIVRVVPAIRRIKPSAGTSSRPGETVHQALRQVGRRWEAWATSLLLFGVSLVLLLEFGRHDVFAPLPGFAAILVTLALIGAGIYAFHRVYRLLRYRESLTSALRQHNEMARRLVEVQLRGNRDFASVALDQFCIDHVVVGADGVYALQMMVPPTGSEAAKLVANELHFSPLPERRSILPFRAAVVELQKLIRTELGIDIQVKPVVVVPECRVQGAQSDDVLLVNLLSCAAFIGWRQGESFLHTDDRAALSAWLSERCVARTRGGLKAAAARLQHCGGVPAIN